MTLNNFSRAVNLGKRIGLQPLRYAFHFFSPETAFFRSPLVGFHLFRFPGALGDQCAYDVFQIAETGGDAFYWWDFGGVEFNVLFYYQPAGIAVLL